MILNKDTGCSMDKSLSSPEDNIELLKKNLSVLFDSMEKNKFSCFEDMGNNNDTKDNNYGEFKATYMEKQKKIGMNENIRFKYKKE